MNYSMFLPQTAEVDIHTAGGQQADDINSVAEFIRIELGYDRTADDEDDDSGQNFHLVNAVDYFYRQETTVLADQQFVSLTTPAFPEYPAARILSPYYEIIAPPPEA